MSEAPKFTSGDWNPFESLRTKTSNKDRIESHGAFSGRHLKNALAFQAQHHKNVMEYQAEGYRLEGKHQTKLAGLSEKAEAASHGRTLELHTAINKAAEGGTGVKVAFPSGMAAEYTKAKPKVRTNTPSSVAPVETPTETKQKFAHRDPKTKQITEYKDYPQGPLKPTAAKKKAAPKKKSR